MAWLSRPSTPLFFAQQGVDARHGPALGPAGGRTRVAGHDVEKLIKPTEKRR
jgi:hypothetical protein